MLTWVDIQANINTYFKQPNYEVDVVEYTETTKSPFAVAEVGLICVSMCMQWLLTEVKQILSLQLGLGVAADAANFTGNVLVVTGEYDFFACAGYCPGFLVDNLTPLYSGAKSLEIAIHPDSG